jgi:hypothetical protein
MRGWLLAGVGALGVIAVVVAACDDANVHILMGQPFDTQNHCLGPKSSVDVLSGPGTGDNCAPECVVASADDASYVYVTTTCPPYAPDYVTEAPDQTHGASDPCVAAFAAYDAGTLCNGDGGAGNEAGGDGGADGASSVDASDGATAPNDAAGD